MVLAISEVYGAPGILEGPRSQHSSPPLVGDRQRIECSLNLKTRTLSQSSLFHSGIFIVCLLYVGFGSRAGHGDVSVTIAEWQHTPKLGGEKHHWRTHGFWGEESEHSRVAYFCWDLIWERLKTGDDSEAGDWSFLESVSLMCIYWDLHWPIKALHVACPYGLSVWDGLDFLIMSVEFQENWSEGHFRTLFEKSWHHLASLLPHWLTQ